MKKKSNESGFTLVELVVVIALLTIMMGAILNLLTPIKNVYSDTETTKDTKTTGEGIISYIEDTLRYSTNVLVLENYVGVPEISATGTVGGGNMAYTNCLIIDNTNLRGTSLDDFTGSDYNVETRKGCTGTVLGVSNLNGGTGVIDVSDAKIALGDNFYKAYTHNITVKTVQDGSKINLNCAISSFKPEYNGTAYTTAGGEAEYTAERTFDLVNINYDTGDGFTVIDDIDFDASADYSTYPQVKSSDIPSGLTTYQQGMYDTTNSSNKYTYIFYVVKDTNDELEYNITFQYSTSDPDPAYAGKQIGVTSTVKANEQFPVSQIPVCPDRTGEGFLAVYYFNDGIANIDLTNYYVTEDKVISVVYTEDTTLTKYAVNFENSDGTTAYSNIKVLQGSTSYSPGNPTADFDDTKQYLEDWVTKDSKVSISTQLIDKDGYVFVPVIKNKAEVTFEVNGTVDSALTQYVKSGEYAMAPTDVPVSTDADKVFDKWVVDGTSNDISTVITGDTKFVAQFKDKPASGVSCSVTTASYKGYNDMITYTFTIQNNTSSDISDWVITAKLPTKLSSLEFAWNFVVSKSGTTATIKTGTKAWELLTVPAGSAKTFVLSGTYAESINSSTDMTKDVYQISDVEIKLNS